ncbi:O-antigen ligase family protein [Arthrobacter liuii]|nr:O-antigen ligase family protein [Arthrobacter liuii]
MSKQLKGLWLLYFAGMSLTGVIFMVGPASVRLEHLCLPLLVFLTVRLLTSPILPSETRLPKPPMAMIVLLSVTWVLLALVVTVVRAPEANKSIWVLVQISTGILGFLLVRPVSNSIKIELVLIGTKFLMLLCIVSVLSFCLVVFAGLPSKSVIGVSSDLRLVGVSFEPNIFASQIIGWLAVLYYWRDDLPRWTRKASVVLVVAVILAGTRAAWIALIILFALWVVTGYKGRPMATIFAIFPIAAAGLYLSFYTPATGVYNQLPLVDRFFSLMDTESGTGAYRLQIYDLAYSDINASGRWFFGSGMNTFSQHNLVDPTNVGAAYLSSVWWALLYDVGIIGLIFFVAILLVGFVGAERKIGALAVYVVVLVCASTTNLIWFAYPWLYWGLIGLRESSAGREAALSHGLSDGHKPLERFRYPISPKDVLG